MPGFLSYSTSLSRKTSLTLLFPHLCSNFYPVVLKVRAFQAASSFGYSKSAPQWPVLQVQLKKLGELIPLCEFISISTRVQGFFRDTHL